MIQRKNMLQEVQDWLEEIEGVKIFRSPSLRVQRDLFEGPECYDRLVAFWPGVAHFEFDPSLWNSGRFPVSLGVKLRLSGKTGICRQWRKTLIEMEVE